MITDGLLKNLARIGSQQYQRKFCIHGTALEYCLLDELLETTMYAARHRATHPGLSGTLTDQERNALLKFHSRVNELIEQIPWQDSSVSIEQIVERNDAMRQVREAAGECLQSLHATFTLDELSSG